MLRHIHCNREANDILPILENKFVYLCSTTKNDYSSQSHHIQRATTPQSFVFDIFTHAQKMEGISCNKFYTHGILSFTQSSALDLRQIFISIWGCKYFWRMSCVTRSLSAQTPMRSVTVKHVPKFKFFASLPDCTGNISMLKNNYLLKQLSLLQPQCSMAVLLFQNFRKTWKNQKQLRNAASIIIPSRKS